MTTPDDLNIALAQAVKRAGGLRPLATRTGLPLTSLWRAVNTGQVSTRVAAALEGLTELSSDPPKTSRPKRRQPTHVAGDALVALRVSKGLMVTDVATLTELAPEQLYSWEHRTIRRTDFQHITSCLQHLKPALYVLPAALTAVRRNCRVSLGQAALALGLTKTTLHRLEHGTAPISQYLLERALRVFPHVPMPTHAGQRLKRFLDAYGVTATQVEALLDLRHHAVTHLMKQSREHPLNARVRQAIVEHTGVDAEPTVVSAQAIIAERARQSLTLTEAAQLLAVSPSRLATIERTHAHLPLVLRLARPKEPRGR